MTKAAAASSRLDSIGERARELAGVVLFGFAAFVLLSIASFSEPNGAEPGATSNLCGRIGYQLAREALFSFGSACYLGVVVLFTWAISLLSRRPVQVGPFRILWFGLLLFATAALLSHTSTATALDIPDRGGLVGLELSTMLEHDFGFGPWGTRLVLLVAVVVLFMLATDLALYNAAVWCVGFLRRRRENAAAVARATGPFFRSLVTSTRRPAKAPPKKARAARRKSAARRTEPDPDEEVPADSADAEVDADALDDPGEEDDDEADEADVTCAGEDSESSGDSVEDGPEPAMLDEDPEAEVEPEPDKKPVKRQARIRLEPPKGRSRGAGFESEPTAFEAPELEADYHYEFPSRQLLERPRPVPPGEFQKMIEGNVERLEAALASFKVEAEVEEIQKGPVITMFEVQVAPGTRVDRIRALEDDLAIRLKAPSVRIVAPIPGKSTIGIEVPNQIRETVCLRELLESPDYDSSKYAIPVFLGKDAAGRPLIEDLARMPHLLVAGSTGSGKSVCLNSIIMSILFTRTPQQVRLILIDPKMVELSLYENIPHLMCPVVRDMNRAAQILEWACSKMDERYELLAEVGARNIFAYNKIPEDEKRARLGVAEDDDSFEAKMPFVVIVVDELADLMMVSAKEVENYITRLAQKSRAVGIHIILATQRPSTNVITGLIKANMPTRVSFQVASKVDARVVLDQNGAEKLLGFGDMLYLPPRSSMLVRGQGAFVADEEIKAVVDAIRVEKPLYSRELMQKSTRSEVDPREVDELYEEAARFVCETQRGSASLLQRKFAIGYTRASRLIDLMANDGILGEYRNAQAREVLVTLDEFEERMAANP